jgi:predicted RNA-binding Zn ribbon-like protein
MPTAENAAAPGRLGLLEAFVNTLDLPAGPDLLGSPEAATQWCRSHGLPPISNAREAERFRAFREAIRDVLFANNGEADPAPAWQALQPFVRGAQFGIVLGPGREPALEPGGAGVDRAIAMMLAIVYDALAAGTWMRLRACRKSDCKFAYYDHSKNGSRAWCSMAVCGNREKAQRRRSRERHDHPRHSGD